MLSASTLNTYPFKLLSFDYIQTLEKLGCLRDRRNLSWGVVGACTKQSCCPSEMCMEPWGMVKMVLTLQLFCPFLSKSTLFHHIQNFQLKVPVSYSRNRLTNRATWKLLLFLLFQQNSNQQFRVQLPRLRLCPLHFSYIFTAKSLS